MLNQAATLRDSQALEVPLFEPYRLSVYEGEPPMKSPFRFWMTGGIAMIVAALGGTRAFAAEERLTRATGSRFGVTETVQRIEACAERHGMPVLVRLQQSLGDDTDRQRLVIVFESSQGGTPVLMTSSDASPDLLLRVVVQRDAEGGTEVLLRGAQLDELPEGLSPELLHDLADLPALVQEALS